MAEDLLNRLKLDPGTRTLGELLQEREWAVHEIVRLRTLQRETPHTGADVRGPLVERIAANSDNSSLEMHRLVRLREVCSLTGLSRGTIYRLQADGTFPHSVKTGANSARWRMKDIVQWIAARR